MEQILLVLLIVHLLQDAGNAVPPVCHLVVRAVIVDFAKPGRRAYILSTHKIPPYPVSQAENRTGGLRREAASDMGEEMPSSTERPFNIDRCSYKGSEHGQLDDSTMNNHALTWDG